MKYILVFITSLYTSSLLACDKESNLPIIILGSIVQSDAAKNVVLVKAVKGVAKWYKHGDTIEPNYKVLKISKYSTMLQTGSSVHEIALSNCNASTELDNPHLYLAQNNEQELYDEINPNTELVPGQSRTFSQPPEPHSLEIDNVELQIIENTKNESGRTFFIPPVDVNDSQQLNDEVAISDGLFK